MWIANLRCPYYHELGFFWRKDGFNDITWKFELSQALLSQAQMFVRMLQI